MRRKVALAGHRPFEAKSKLLRLPTIAGFLTIFGAFLLLNSLGALAAEPAPDTDKAELIEAKDNKRNGSYIVFLKNDSAKKSETHRWLQTKTANGASSSPRSAERTIYPVNLDANQLETLRNDPNVDVIVEDFSIPRPRKPESIVDSFTPDPNDLSWALDRIDQRPGELDDSYQPAGTGKGVDIYIFDTGIRRTHNEFGGRVIGGKSFTDSEPDPYNDCHGHGTKVASAAAGKTVGVAQNANLLSIKVMTCDEGAWFSDVAEASAWVIENRSGPSVANFSFGGLSESTAYHPVISRLVEANISVIAGAGNDAADACSFQPSNAPDAIAVGATRKTDLLAIFSNTGPCVDIFAPGSGVPVATAANDTSSQFWSGTSLSSPMVAGAAAIFLEKEPGATPAQVRSHLIGRSTKGALTQADGSHNRLLYVGVPPGQIDQCLPAGGKNPGTECGPAKPPLSHIGSASPTKPTPTPTKPTPTPTKPTPTPTKPTPTPTKPTPTPTKPTSASTTPHEATICRGPVTPTPDAEPAKRAFERPVDKGGCGMAWNDQQLGHQCEWVSGERQGWVCFGKTR